MIGGGLDHGQDHGRGERGGGWVQNFENLQWALGGWKHGRVGEARLEARPWVRGWRLIFSKMNSIRDKFCEPRPWGG